MAFLGPDYGMGLIHELELLQQEHGHLTDVLLRELAHFQATPLYRIQELVSFYPHFRTTPPAAVTVSVCRDMSCHLAQADGLAAKLAAGLRDADVETVVGQTVPMHHVASGPVIPTKATPKADMSASDRLWPR